MLEIAGNYSTPHAGNLEFEEVLEMLEIPACCKNFATLNRHIINCRSRFLNFADSPEVKVFNVLPKKV